jgi:hypothetical protein
MHTFYTKSFGYFWMAVFFSTTVLAVPASPLTSLLKPAGKIGRPAAQAEWGFVTYIQADNNLAPYAVFNVNEMQKANIPSTLNVLVEWDRPNDAKTWRYRVQKRSLTDVGSFTGAHDLGYDPVQEVIDLATWAKANYNAKRWCFVLWNHGSGVIDPYEQRTKQIAPLYASWLRPVGMGNAKERGILFDDTQGTYATNTQLTTMFQGVRTALGAPVDVVGMDACLMAMIEIGYQLVGLAKYLVASQNIEPGYGWHYAGILGSLSANTASVTPLALARAIVQQYGVFYRGVDNTITQSAISVDALVRLKNNVNALVAAVANCRAANALKTQVAVSAARAASIEFDLTDYIDMYSFYAALGTEMTKSVRAINPKSKVKADVSYLAAVNALQAILTTGKTLITASVVANTVGSAYAQARGLSIYFPTGAVDASYRNTAFARDTNWDDFLAIY